MKKKTRKEVTITSRVGAVDSVKADALVVGIPEETKRLGGTLRLVDQATGGALRRAIDRGVARGKAGQAVVLTPESGPFDRVVVAGLGPAEEADDETIRRAAAAGLRAAGRTGAGAISATLFEVKGRGAADRARAMAEGFALGAYAFDRYRTENGGGGTNVRRVTLLSAKSESGLAAAVKRGRAVGESSNWTRELSNTAPADLTPAAMATEARALARKHELKCRVYDVAWLKKAGMRAILAVGQGSSHPPRLIHLEYVPKGKAAKTVALVGKGITFDTGGISLKPWSGMWDMKFDKCGATAALGAIRAAAELALPIRVHAIVAAAENMPSGDAYRPGDVVETAAGKTVEVHSTDAEGRLVLADALHYTGKLKPDVVVDLATLTGACVVALGDKAAGLFTKSDALSDALVNAGRESGERVWPMPLFDEYRRQLDSKVADMKNVGGRGAGAVTAAKFLEEFAGDFEWAHLDIAGVANGDAKTGYSVPGATGFGVRLLARWLEGLGG